MAIKKKKEVTINGLAKTVDNLAVSMEAGFKRVDERFKTSDKKMEAGFKRADKKMEAGFKRSDERLEKTVNNLAIMIGNGFNEMKESNAREHKEIIESNEREHEEIKTRLDNVAYRFELVELQKRVEILERRNGIKIV